MSRILISIYSDIPTWNIPDAHVEQLRREFPRHEFVQAKNPDETLARIRDAEVAFSSQIYDDALGASTGLKWIHSPAAGIGSMLSPTMIASPVVLTNSRGNHAEAIAEHVVGVVLALYRKLPEAFRHQVAHRWAHEEMTSGEPFRLIRGSVFGIVGSGGIGSTIARLASALGASVEGIRRRPELGVPEGMSAVFAPGQLRGRLPAWDVIVLATPLTAETRGLVGRDELRLMKRDAILVNIGRGKLVKEADLVEALRERTIAAAALDVAEHEPLDPASQLWDLPNALITPHVAGLRPDHWDLALNLFADNLRRFDAGQPLLNVVDKSAGY
ncbi:MAG: D-2-hydroxyacid dehydrogenase [Acidobacteriota bacterium]